MQVAYNSIRLKDNAELPAGGLYKERLLQAIRILGHLND